MIIIGVNTEKNNFKINSKIQCIQIEISRKYRKEQLVETLGAFENGKMNNII